jgi:cell division protein ZapD
MIESAIIYEQPLNELIRVCLRLEQLFKQIDHQIDDITVLGTRNTVTSLINLLQLLDRPDLKTKLAKELSYHASNLARLENTPEIDDVKLHKLLRQLDELSRCFIDSSGKIGQNIREVELLNSLRLHLASPGGGCSFDIPLFHYWLQQPGEYRQAIFKDWLEEFNSVRITATLILQLIREGTKSSEKCATNGFYQELLDPALNLKLIRVAIPLGINAYPEISVGRHFLSVRFFAPSINERPAQYTDDLPFWISQGN